MYDLTGTFWLLGAPFSNLQEDRENKTNPAKATDWSGIVDFRESSLFSEFGVLRALLIASDIYLEDGSVREQIGIKGGRKVPESLSVPWCLLPRFRLHSDPRILKKKVVN